MMPEGLEVAGRHFGASEVLVEQVLEQVLCWGLHAERDHAGLERCAAMRMISSCSSSFNKLLTDGSAKCSPIRAAKLPGWPT